MYVPNTPLLFQTPRFCVKRPVSTRNKKNRFYVKQICLHVDGSASLWTNPYLCGRTRILVDESASVWTNLYLWGQLSFLFRLDRIVSVWTALLQRSSNKFFLCFSEKLFYHALLDHDCHCLFKPLLIHYFFAGTRIATNKTKNWRKKQTRTRTLG